MLHAAPANADADRDPGFPEAPEDRYPTADRVFADLQTVADQLAGTGAIVEFPLARADVTRQFEPPAPAVRSRLWT